MSKSKGDNLPHKALNLFDALINQLIDGTEKLSYNPQFLNEGTQSTPLCTTSIARSKYGRRHPSLASSTLKKCSRPSSSLRSVPESEGEYDFENNIFESSGASGSTVEMIYNAKAIRDFINVESDEEEEISTEILDKMLRSGPSIVKSTASVSSLASSFTQVRCCDEPHSYSPQIRRQEAGHDTSSSLDALSDEVSQQRATLTTKRLANGINGCEVTFSTQNFDGTPLIIRAVLPNFHARRVWVNGKPFEYIDSESDEPIIDSSVDFVGTPDTEFDEEETTLKY